MNQKPMHIFITFIISALVWCAFALPVHAQTSSSAQALPTRDQAYLRDLVALSETIGGAHAVRVRCNGQDDQYWRTYMVQILGIEAPNQGVLRSQMVSGFNTGFAREDSVRIGCDASSNEREARYAVTGRRLAEGLAAFYFPKRSN